MHPAEVNRQVRALVDEGKAISEIARLLRITAYAARLTWIAAVDGGPDAALCAKCGAAGELDGHPCRECRGTGVA